MFKPTSRSWRVESAFVCFLKSKLGGDPLSGGAARRPLSGLMMLGWNLRSGNLLGIPHHEIEGARSNLPKATVAIQRNGDADRGIRSREPEAAFKQPIIDFVDMQWGALFTQQHRHGLRYRTIHKAIADRL